MDVVDPPEITLERTFARDLPELALPWQAATFPDPRLLVLDDALAVELGLDPATLRSPSGVGLLVGASVPAGATPVAQAYAGHQFGGLSPRLGDGRALLLGEIVDPDGRRFDLHLKGSGRTPFSRGGDGKAAVGPMLREYVIGTAMHALGVPTTRALAVVSTGEQVPRDTVLPGAVLARVASSHLRVGTFQYAALQQDEGLLRRLVDHAIARHHPHAVHSPVPALALFDAVVEVQASLVARWMLVGFVHGVMNTDNTTISGETIDYGPCAFMDAFDPATVFSSIDHGGRYAYGNQPRIVQWNLARLAESLLPLIHDDRDEAIALATASLNRFPERYGVHFTAGMRRKLGLADERDGDTELIDDLLALLHAERVDLTGFMRSLSAGVRGDVDRTRNQVADLAAFDAWHARYVARWSASGAEPAQVAAAMERSNPIYVPRNHLVEEALAAATSGDLGPLDRLVEAVSQPFVERPGLARYAEPDPSGSVGYRTFCGT